MNLYILQLKQGKYYIGTTNKDVTDRLQEHMSGRGSAWTKKYKVLKLEKTIENCDKYDEDKWTKIYMDRFGIENVRGGSYCEMNLTSESISCISKEVSHANDRCLFCNKKGHFIRDCPNKNNTKSKYYSKHLNYLNMSCDYESESDCESDYDAWCCQYCDKEFTSKKGATYHENIYCKQNPKRKKSNTYNKKNYYYKKKKKNIDTCENCGSEEHIYCNY
jgi:hypothetical protein